MLAHSSDYDKIELHESNESLSITSLMTIGSDKKLDVRILLRLSSK